MRKILSIIVFAFILTANLKVCPTLILAEAKEVKITASGMTVKVSAGEWKVIGKKGDVIRPDAKLGRDLAPLGRAIIRIKASEFKIDPSTVVSVENEKVQIGDERPNQWAAGTRLKGVVPRRVYHGVPGCLVPNSVVVKSSDGTIYEEDKDYLMDHTWGAMGRLADGNIKKNEKVLVDYKYSVMRLDLIQSDTAGNVTLKKGKEEKVCPLPPQPDEGCEAIANIFLPYSATELTEENIYPIGPPLPEPTKKEMEKNSKVVEKTLAKLRKGDSVTIVAWGNSVTAGGDASLPSKAFPGAFLKLLRQRFPDATIKLKNAGIGGSSTPGRLAEIQKEVIKFNPDLVTIEFVNDMGLPENTLRANWFSAIDQIKEAGGEVIIITPHFVMPAWMNVTSVKEARETRPQVQWLRDIAEEKGAGVADASRRWEHLASEGIPYTTLLWNGINHPDDRGHLIFAQELMKYFPQ